jgi:quinol monooxygenase YgiN
VLYVTMKFTVRDEYIDSWLNLVGDFTRETRSEPGNLFFEWNRSVDTPGEYVLLEGFASQSAAFEHLNSSYFKDAQEIMAKALARRPQRIMADVVETGWSEIVGPPG